MAKDLWLPKGYTLSDGTRIRSLLHSGNNWQIFGGDDSTNILLVRPDLLEKWDTHGFLDASLFGEILFGPEVFQYVRTQKGHILEPVEQGKTPDNMIDALAFALALRESRKLSADVSFHDALYVEQYSRLLPTWTLTPHINDEVVLGAWLTGGVAIATTSFRRLAHLTGWMPTGDLAKVIKAAGLGLPADADLLARRKNAVLGQTAVNVASAKKAGDSDQAPQCENPAKPEGFKLPGRPQLESFFNEHIIDIICNSEKYQALGIDFPSAVVLHGPPGCGKTFAVDRLVEFIDWPVYLINSNTIGSPYIHATSKKISEIFDHAIEDAPSVVVIDEMESFLADRALESSSSLHSVEEVAEFLRRIPEAIEKRVLIIAMTNMIKMIDPAILRRGRFDHIIEVGMPSKEEVASLVTSLLSKLPKNDELNLDNLIDTLTGKALSDAAFVIRESARLAAKSGKVRLDQESIDMALSNFPRKEQAKHTRSIGFVQKG